MTDRRSREVPKQRDQPRGQSPTSAYKTNLIGMGKNPRKWEQNRIGGSSSSVKPRDASPARGLEAEGSPSVPKSLDTSEPRNSPELYRANLSGDRYKKVLEGGELADKGLDAIKSVSRKDLAQLVDWVRQNSVEAFSGKNLLELAKKTMDLVWRNGRLLSGKDFMPLMVISLALAGGVEGVKVRGKDGCVAESNIVVDKHPLAQNNIHRMVTACFNERIGDMLLRYVENPCDSRYRELQLTFIDSDFERSFPDALGLTYEDTSGRRMFLHPNEQRHKDTDETLRGSFYHELTHWLQEFAEVPKDANRSLHRENRLIAELRAEYSVAVYGSDQDIEGWRWPPDLERPREKAPQADSLDLLNQLESSVSNPLHTASEPTLHYSDNRGYGHGGLFQADSLDLLNQLESSVSNPLHTASEPTLHYSDNRGYGHGGLFWAWLDEKFPGFVDNVTNLARRKPIGLKDCEQFTNGQSLDTLWGKYKKCDFTEIKSILEAQRKKYVGSHERLLQGKDEL